MGGGGKMTAENNLGGGLMFAVWVGTRPTENFGRARGYKGGGECPPAPP